MAYSRAITQKVKDVEKKLDEVQKDVKDNAKHLEKVDQNMDDMKKELEKLKNKNKEETATYITAEEYRERESRRTNVIIHRVKEPAGTTAEERRTADMHECENILLTIGLPEERKDIRTCRRIGERGEVPRPMVVVMNKESSRTAILAAARKLHNTQYQDVSIVPDLTQQQRKEETGLTEEATRRNNEELTDEDSKKLDMAGGGSARCTETYQSLHKDKTRIQPARERLHGSQRNAAWASCPATHGASCPARGGQTDSHRAGATPQPEENPRVPPSEDTQQARADNLGGRGDGGGGGGHGGGGGGDREPRPQKI
jgi:hypothetical protein